MTWPIFRLTLSRTERNNLTIRNLNQSHEHFLCPHLKNQGILLSVHPGKAFSFDNCRILHYRSQT